MRASGRITASIAIRSSRRDPPKQPTYSRLTCSAANALEYWEPRKFQGERENRTDKCGWQSQDVNKRLKLLVGTRPVLPTADRTISRKTNCPRTFLLSEAFRVRLACGWMSRIGPRLPSWAVALDDSYPGISGLPAPASKTRSACAEAQPPKHHFDASPLPGRG